MSMFHLRHAAPVVDMRLLFLLMAITSAARPPLDSDSRGPGPGKGSGEYHREVGVVVTKGSQEPCNAIVAQPVIETYVIEHEVSEPNARKAVTEVSDEHLIAMKTGCAKCTKSDIDYCSGGGVIDDHCCCDGKFTESFPFVPHTCLRGRNVCRPTQSDCEEYARIRDCCCKIHLVSKYRNKFIRNGSSSRHKLDTKRVFWILPLSLVTISIALVI